MNKTNNNLLAQKYWEQVKRDLIESKRALKQKKYTSCVYLAVQSAMNALSTLCVAKKRYQNPTYSLSELLRVCLVFHEELSEVKEVCEKMDEVQDRSPFFDALKQGKVIDYESAKDFPVNAKKIVQFCEGIIRKKKVLQSN